MITRLATVRTAAAGMLAMSLAACADLAPIVAQLDPTTPSTAPPPGPAPAAATAAAPKADALVHLNEAFRSNYRDLRSWAISKSDPVIIVQFDDLHLVRNGVTTTEKFTPAIYHEYKAIAHIPLTLYVMLARHVGRPFDKAMLDRLTDYLKRVQAAGASLDGRPGWTPEQLTLHKRIVAESVKLIETVGGAEQVNEDQLTAYARAMRPLVLESADAAARKQLDGLHALVNKWKGVLGGKWSHVDVIVLGPKQPRVGNLQYAYFKRAMGPRVEGRRLFYAEGIFDKDGGLNLFGTIQVDRGASIAFFDDPYRLERDLLADAAERHINRLFPNR